MRHSKKVDTTLKERHGILHLLERLKHESLTLDDMEEIGTNLQKSGERALSPLVRRLWRERSSDLISRYAYLLDFFEEEEWITQLVQIALQRRDLDEEGKGVLLSALKGYGVDITAPPFARLLAEAATSTDHIVCRFLDRGTEGYVAFMEDFLCHSRDVQSVIIHQLAKVRDSRILDLLEILLWFDDEEVVRETVVVLGRIRTSGAALLLEKFRLRSAGELHHLAERSLLRLSFLGIHPDTTNPPDPLPFHAACASPFDGSGCRSLWISRWDATGRVSALYLHLHELDGIKGGWSCTDGLEEMNGQLRNLSDEDGLVTIPIEYAVALLGDAMSRNRRAGSFLPAELHVQRPRLFEGQILKSEPYEPPVPAEATVQHPVAARTIAATSSLFDDDFFADWFIATAAVYDLAEEWNEQERDGKVGESALLERFCRDILAPDLERIRHRLLLSADLMRHAGRDQSLIELTYAAAVTLPLPPLPCNFHPFLRRFALESITIIRETLAEGYDLRQYLDIDDDEWG